MCIRDSYRGNDEVANFLIDNKAEVNYVSKNGTALMAVSYTHLDVYKRQLWECKTKPNI